MTPEQEQELVENVKSITDRLDQVDKILAANKMGVDLVLAFRCGHSGLYFPGDYVKMWGVLYGIGLGPDPVTECLDSDYATDPPPITRDLRTATQIMHPLRHIRVQVDSDTVPRAVFDANRAILMMEDWNLDRRAPILRANQLKNPRSKLPYLLRGLDQVRGGSPG